MGVRLTMMVSGRAFGEKTFADEVEQIRIGRSPDCELKLDNLSVSRHHCEIRSEQGVHRLVATGSNAVFVNGERVRAHALNDGDLITLGKVTVAYACEGPRARTAERRGVPAGAATLVGGADALKAAGESLRHAQGYLLPLAGGPPVELERPFYLFGKAERAEFRLSGFRAPRLAAVLVRDELGFRLLDLGSKPGSLVVAGQPRKEARLQAGETFSVRELTFVFHPGRPA